MGIVREPEKAKLVFRLTERGKELAQAYEKSIAHTVYFQKLDPAGQLAEISHKMHLSTELLVVLIPKIIDFGADRDLLLDTFFRFDQRGSETHIFRRRLTFGVALDLI